MRKLIFSIFIIYGLHVFFNKNTEIEIKNKVSTYETSTNLDLPLNYSVHELKMKGKHLIFCNYTPRFVYYITIQEQGNNIKAYIIEELHENRWCEIYRGSKIGKKTVIPINNTIYDHLRLKILKSERKPHISSFKLFFTTNISP